MLLIGVYSLMVISNATAQFQKVETAIDSLIKEFQAAGLSVAVVKNDKIIYTHAFGFQNIEENKPLQTEHLFRIASISKSFTSTALLQLVEQGRISLDDDVSNLVGFTVRNPNFPDKTITLRMLLSHRSSLNDSQGYFNLDVIDPTTGTSYQKCYNSYEIGRAHV